MWTQIINDSDDDPCTARTKIAPGRIQYVQPLHAGTDRGGAETATRMQGADKH